MATLQILKEIMTAVNQQQQTRGQDTPASQGGIKPCDYFDLICGTSTGGLIALMLGRLEFTVDDAIQKYKQLANEIFKKEKAFSWNAKYDHKPLERKLKEVISDSVSPLRLDENALLVDNNRPCKSFVVTTNLTSHSAKPVRVRSGTHQQKVSQDMGSWKSHISCTNVLRPVQDGRRVGNRRRDDCQQSN